MAKLKNFDIKVQIGTQAPIFLPPTGNDVNTKADEMYPWITANGRYLFFSRKTEDGWKQFIADGPTPGPVGKAKEAGFAADFHRATVNAAMLTISESLAPS